MTAGSLVGSVTLAVAVDAESVPLSAVLVDVLEAPMKPTTVTLSAVPTGTLAAEMFTVTGLVVVPGSTTSGARNDPVGFADTVTPPTEVIWSVGEFASVTDVGAPELT